MKSSFFGVLLISALAAAPAFASQTLYFYNGEGISIAVQDDGSAQITESCGEIRIDSGWNTEGRLMHGLSAGGPVGTIRSEVTLRATEIDNGSDSIELNVSDENVSQVLQKADKPAFFMECL